MRDIRLDLFRIFCMYLICLIHVIGYADSRWTHPLVNVSFAGVLGFVLISGYYGIRFSWFKILKLEVTALYCAAFVTILGEALTSHVLTFSNFQTVISIWKSYWFIHAYVFMTCLVTLVPNLPPNKLSNSKNIKSSCFQTFLPVIVIVYGWSFLTLIPGVQTCVPRTPGLEAYGGITLFAVYLIGRLYRANEWDCLSPWLVYPIALVGGTLAAVSGKGGLNWAGALARYNTPTLLVTALGLFYFFRHAGSFVNGNIQTIESSNTQPLKPSIIQPFLSFLLPSILPVYLIHCNPYGFKIIAYFESFAETHGFPSTVLTFLILSGIVFVGGIFLDLPRRVICRTLRLMSERGVASLSKWRS